MFKTGFAVAGISLVLLFGYFYVTNNSDAPQSEKAKQAALDVGDAVRDKGVAGLVDVRLKSKFGLDATRFLHVYYDDGRVLLYGLVPESISAEALAAQADEVPGVDSVDVLVQPRPAYVAPLRPIAGSNAPATPPPSAGGPTTP